MTDQQATGQAGRPGALPGKQPRTMAVQGLANGVMRGMLATPLLARAVGGKLVTLYFVGRKSGRRYTLPVAYTRDGADLLVGTPFKWGRNLRTGEPVEIRLKGRRRQADVVVYSGEAEVTAAYTIMCRANRTFANFNKIGFDPAGRPEPEDLHRAWLAGARAFRLTPG